MTFPPLKGEGRCAKRVGEGSFESQASVSTPTRRPAAAILPLSGRGRTSPLQVRRRSCLEIDLQHLRIVLYFLRRSLGEDGAVMQHCNAVTQLHHHLHVVLDN